jgi:hypothetical protein
MPTTVTPISHKQEKTLLDAMTGAIKLANDGMGANEAIAKSACDNGLTPEFAKRMVEAFNASKTLSHMKKTAGAARSESFSLADSDEVIKLMYVEPATEKTASFRSLAGLGVVNVCTRTGIEKAAAALRSEPIKRDCLLTTKMEKLSSLRTELKNTVGNLRAEARYANVKVAEAFEKLAALLRVPGGERFSAIEERVWHTYGDAGKRVMDAVWETHDFERFGEKRAEARPETPRVMGMSPVYEAVRELMSSIDKAARAHADFTKAAADADLAAVADNEARRAAAMAAKREMTWAEADKELKKGQPVGYEPTTLDQDTLTAALMTQREEAERQQHFTFKAKNEAEVAKQQAETEKAKQQNMANQSARDAEKLRLADEDRASKAQNDTFTAWSGAKDLPSIFQSTGIMAKPPEAGAADHTPGGRIIDVQHDTDLRSIQTKVMLNDMISNDPYLSTYAPVDVFSAYNQAAQLTPGLAHSPLFMRSLMLRILQTGGRIDPQEIKSMLDAESVQRGIRMKGF